MATLTGIKQQIVKSLDKLPEESLLEIATFMDYLQYKQTRHTSQHSPYTPIRLGGLWEGITIAEEDIAEVRQEMWQNFGENED